ncbi:MAG: DoxX family membrane protein, partial [Phycisphaerales bacterium]|nr:DoxX family membrane protein [Phycisphaerales bacterium]
MSAWRWVESIVLLLPVRLGLAGLFGVAAALKISDPQAFAFSIKAFDVLDPARHEHALVMLAFGIPWAEMIVSVFLLLGLWTRACGLL